MSSGIFYTIGEAVDLTHVSHRTLRHYEEFFNLDITRDSSGNRIYNDEDLEIINVIIDMKKKGMKLEGIRIYLEDKSLISKKDNGEVILVDSMALEAKELFLGEIRKTINDSFNDNPVLKELLEENKLLREKLESTEKTYNEKEILLIEEIKNLKLNMISINEKLENKKPWYKRLLNI